MSDETKGKTVSAGLGLGALISGLVSAGGAAAGSPDIVSAAERIGIPMAILLGLAFLLSKTGVWFATKVVEPLVSALRGFIGTVAEENRKQSATLSALHGCMQEMRTEASEDRASAAADRATHRLALEELRDRMSRPPNN